MNYFTDFYLGLAFFVAVILLGLALAFFSARADLDDCEPE